MPRARPSSDISKVSVNVRSGASFMAATHVPDSGPSAIVQGRSSSADGAGSGSDSGSSGSSRGSSASAIARLYAVTAEHTDDCTRYSSTA